MICYKSNLSAYEFFKRRLLWRLFFAFNLCFACNRQVVKYKNAKLESLQKTAESLCD